MSTLKSLKAKIASVKSMQKITSAMEAVSIVKLKRSRAILNNIREYSDEIDTLVSLVSQSIDDESLKSDTHDVVKRLKAFLGYIKPDEGAHLLIVSSPDRGLCGSLNSNIIKETDLKIQKYLTDGRAVLLMPFGKKISQFLHQKYPSLLVTKDLVTTSKIQESDVLSISKVIYDLFLQGKVSSSSFVYMHFESPIKQTIQEELLAPYALKNTENKPPKNNYVYEPCPLVLLENLITDEIFSSIWHLILETVASEHAARIVAMKNSTENAKKAAKNLTIQYNRKRQSMITSEMLDIVGGKEAL